jgi:colanic acid/amylovoran biosynthesis glycosyltransferase
MMVSDCKKKILVVSDYFGNKTTTFVYNEVLGLQQHFDVKYLCTQRNNPEDFPFEDVIEIPFLENRIVRKLKWWAEIYDWYLSFWNPAYARKLNALVQAFQPDLIHCHFGYEALRFYGNFRRKDFPDIPILVSFRGHDASFHLQRKSYVKALSKMLNDPRVYPTFVCKFLRQNLEKKGISIGEHLILYSGTRTDFFKREQPFPRDEPYLFFQVAHFERRKGQQEAIYAFKKLVHHWPNAGTPRLILAGGGPTLEACKRLVADLGLEQWVEFPGWLRPEDTKAWLEKTRVFIHHSLTIDENTEGIPNALMEAMAMEVPVVSTRHAGIPELVEDGHHGRLVKEGDVEAFADAMIAVADWGQQPDNRKKIEHQFSFPRHMESLISFYHNVMSR